MRLRILDPEDDRLETELDRMFALDQSCFTAGIAYSREELAGFLAHPSAFSVLLEDGPQVGSLHGASSPSGPSNRHGELLGFAIARPWQSRGKRVFHIITIDVAPQARRRGVGTLLMDWMVDKGRELSLEALRLEVAVDNADALAFYRRLGFAQVGRIAGYYLGHTDALVLERDIAVGRGFSKALRLVRQASGR